MRPLAYIHRRRWLRLTLALLAAVAITVVALAGATEPIDSYAACTQAGYPVLATDPPVCHVGNRTFTGTPVPTPALVASKQSIPFEILVDGDTRSSVPNHHQDVFFTQTDWVAYWHSVHAGLPTVPPLIPVDFATSSVVALSLGAQPTSGYGLKITEISQTEAGTTVDLTESTPTVTCPVLTQITNRYLIVRTPKLLKPVSFRITSQKRHCQ